MPVVEEDLPVSTQPVEESFVPEAVPAAKEAVAED
jgi:hypothetical protein